MRLYSDDHLGYFLSQSLTPGIRRLLDVCRFILHTTRCNGTLMYLDFCCLGYLVVRGSREPGRGEGAGGDCHAHQAPG
jgi:hypothetical protein